MADNKKKGVDPNAWMVTFGDLLMLLLTFFVLLLTMKVMDSDTNRRFFDYFVQTEGELEFTDESSRDEVAESSEKRFVLNKAMLRKTLKTDYSDFKRHFGVYEDGRGVIITLDTEYLFEAGKADMRKDRLEILDIAGRLLSSVSNDIVITGHTDNTPIRGGRYRSNWELSLYRSLAVFDYFTTVYGLDPWQIATGGSGDTRPLVPNTDQVKRAKNRRVEFLLKKK